jgi:tetratricopeptide (TPR) repeat protein
MPHSVFFILTLVTLVLLTRSLTVLLHELGHAIPAILLTKNKVTIYIGSYGDPSSSLKINMGALIIYFRYNLFSWKLGLCIPSAKSIPINNQIIYTLTGPIASLFIACITCYFAITYDLHGMLKLFLILFLGSALLDLFVNLTPSNTPIQLYDGTVAFNDGYSLKRLSYYRRMRKEYERAADLYNAQQYAEAAIRSEKLLSYIKDDFIYRLAISSYLQNKNYVKAKDLSDAFAVTGDLNSDDLSNLGLSYSQLDFHDEAMEFYNKSLLQNPHNKNSLCNKGYTLNLLGKFEEAIPFFDKAILLDKDFAYPYNNRGLSKIKLGQTEEGLEDINCSFKLDPNNSYAYRNLGIYCIDKGEYEEALQQLTKAKKLDSTTHIIDQLIFETNTKLIEVQNLQELAKARLTAGLD